MEIAVQSKVSLEVIRPGPSGCMGRRTRPQGGLGRLKVCVVV